MKMITVFFDDQCGMCSKEIAYYQKITPANTINWFPLSKSQLALQTQGIDYLSALKHLHAVDNENNIYIGVAAFIVIWQQLPRWRWLAKFARFKPVNWLLRHGYKWFAEWRFKRSSHCQIAAQQKD